MPGYVVTVNWKSLKPFADDTIKTDGKSKGLQEAEKAT